MTPCCAPQIRKIIAKRLLESKQQVPHLYVRANADLDPVAAMRASMKLQGTKVRPCHFPAVDDSQEMSQGQLLGTAAMLWVPEHSVSA